MARDIFTEIALNALAPAPSGETPLEERLRLLQNALDCTNQRVQAQRAQMEKLRREMSSYTGLVDQMKRTAAEAEFVAATLPQAAVGRPAPIEAPAPVTAPMAAPLPAALLLAAAPTPRLPMARFIPYAAMAVFAALLSLLAAQRPARASLPIVDVPTPPAIAATERALAQAAEESNTDVLSLIYSFVPPGSRRSVLEVLKPEIESASNSPWVIVRVDSHTTLVSFRPYGEALETAPVYEFTVDPVYKTVTASAETLQNLRGNTIAAR